MNILELRKKLQQFLKTKADRVYYEDAPSAATYPYVVYTLVDSREMLSNREDFDLEVEVWDDSQDTTTLETLTGSIDGDGDIVSPTGLHRKNFYEADKISAKCYRQNRLSIRDEDVRIKRRQLRYVIQTYL